jgi:hypothetical protein
LRKRTVVARSEGGRVEVNGGDTLRERRGRRWWCDSVYGLRKRMVAACFEAGVEAAACFKAGDVAVVCSRLRLRTASGGGGTTVSRVIEQQERAQGQKIAKCSERERGA